MSSLPDRAKLYARLQAGLAELGLAGRRCVRGQLLDYPSC